MYRTLIVLSLLCVTSASVSAQSREEKVREDRRKVTEEGFWIYNDLDKAFAQARESGKPILVVLRCIPCEECVKLDDDLVDQHPVIRPLLDEFVCVRQVSTNGLDLETFQYDTDQSFAAFILNADGTIYGRFGTRSHRTEWLTDVSLDGLAEALQGALALHENYPANKKFLEGKRGGEPEVASPEQFPTLKDKYTDSLNYEGNVVESCIHCHQIGEAQRAFYWDKGQSIPEKVFFPFPHPKSLGLIMDPDKRATVKSVEAESPAAESGLEVGDSIITFDGQPPLSIADIQWVLHETDADGAEVPILVNRDGRNLQLSMKLDGGWRQQSDLSWRVSTWSLRRMMTGGMVLEALSEEERSELGLSGDSMALRARHVGQYGPHAAAKRAGFQVDDVLVSYDGRDDLKSEQELLFYANEQLDIGDKIPVKVRRGNGTKEFVIPIQP